MTALERLRGVCLVVRGDSVVFQAAAGLADDAGHACTPQTQFQIASVSKQFTAAAVMLLAERGLLSVQDPVARWIEGCPASWSAVTIHHLLTHTAGLVHWRDIPEIDLTAPMEAEALLDIFRRTPVRDVPGANWYYSSLGYVLLAHIVQNATGQQYAAFLAEEVFDRVGMHSTFAGSPTHRAAGNGTVAIGHSDGSPTPSFELDVTAMGTGDVWSTVGDMNLWDAALASGSLLTDASRSAMLTAHAAVGWTGAISIDSYGYGWFIGHVSGRRMFFHPGDNAGFQALNAWFPDEEVRLVVLTNEDTTDLEATVGELLAVAFAA
jgi:CubicO group peptidase (beta-lactamase class C family)